jgi:chloride channel 3/4/5
MGGTELVYNLFAMCLPGSPNTHAGLCVLDPGKQTFSVMRMIAVALVVKAALTVVTFGIKVPAGIFIPTLGVGACAGRIVGLAVQYARWRWPNAAVFASCGETGQCVIPGLYAMVGAAAALSGVTRTTVSLAVIMFELTDTLTYTMPVMLGVLVAKTVADALEPKGIYELVIECVKLWLLFCRALVYLSKYPGSHSFRTSTRDTNSYGEAIPSAMPYVRNFSSASPRLSDHRCRWIVT